MIRLNEAEKKISRRRVTYLVENLPPLVEVPVPFSVRDTKWFREAGLEGVLRVYALPCYKIDKFSGKLMPVRGNFEAFEAAGKFERNPVLVVPTSGNFGKDAAGVALGYTVQDVWAVVNSTTPAGKVEQLQAAGATAKLAPSNVSAIEFAYEVADKYGHLIMDQYVRDESITGHKPTMEHIEKEMHRLGEDGGFIFGAITGTCSTLMAARRYLPWATKVAGVASMSKQELIPGSRSPEDLEKLRDIRGIPGFMFRDEWKDVLDFDIIADVTRDEAYAINGELFRYHFSVGPTGALVLAGMLRLVREHFERGELNSLKNEFGAIPIVLLWMDSYFAYDDPSYRRFLIG